MEKRYGAQLTGKFNEKECKNLSGQENIHILGMPG